MKKDFVVIAYDIEDDKKRKKISDTLLDYAGLRVQKSVFECRLTKTKFSKLYKKLHKIRGKGDSIRYYFLCGRCLDKIIPDEFTPLQLDLIEKSVKVV